MPKIIQITKTARKESFLALDDSGQLFAYCPEIAGLSVESWQRILLLPEHMPLAPKSEEPALRTAPQRPEWNAIISGIHLDMRQRHFVQCPCGDHLNTLQLVREHWQLGHFDT